jgi:hypothetical protein
VEGCLCDLRSRAFLLSTETLQCLASLDSLSVFPPSLAHCPALVSHTGAQINSLSTVAAVDRACSYFKESESMDGSTHNAGFLFLYELFTRTVKCRVYGGSSHALACMLLQQYGDSRGGGLMGSILTALANNPDICGDPSLRCVCDCMCVCVCLCVCVFVCLGVCVLGCDCRV